ncbi:unnamed protein product [Rotaria magnacalcarata]|uniref:G-protein coupled receptors family 1 profile domain-containing protein n=1 Tax=Rotaria magnacalcarata TaxID=392030 RepID=A0A816Z2A7_9BILA|nr:unnamed protein product [Rotaria magnacalcarata]
MSKEVSEIEIVIGTVNYYGPIILLAFGIVGCICNLITFTALQLRNNYCAFYFLASTLFDLLSIRFGVSIRFATDHFGSNLLHSDRVYCKLRAYLVSAIPLVSIQMKIAYRVTAIAIVISLFSLSHILYSYDLRPIYATMPGPDAMFDGMFVVIWLGIIPHGLMLLFGFTTVKNIRQVKRQTAVQSYTIQISVESCIQTQERKTNTQLILEFKNEFAPTLLKQYVVSQVNECVYKLDEAMLYYDNGIKEEQNCELLEEKEVHLDYSNIKLVELNNIVLLNTCIVESDENNCEMHWPDGRET